MTEPEFPTVKVRMSPELVAFLETGTDGWRWVFGTPDGEGFYEPTVLKVSMLPGSETAT